MRLLGTYSRAIQEGPQRQFVSPVGGRQWCGRMYIAMYMLVWKNTEQRTCPDGLNGRCDTLNSVRVAVRAVRPFRSSPFYLVVFIVYQTQAVLKELASRWTETVREH